jgi:hypothetical protein
MTVHITRVVTIDHTARDWQLYSSMEGAEDCADRLNRGVARVINENPVRTQAWEAATQILNMRSNAHFGSADTEPLVVLECIFEDVYGPLV